MEKVLRVERVVRMKWRLPVYFVMSVWVAVFTARPSAAEIYPEPWEPEARHWLSVSAPVDFFGAQTFLSYRDTQRLVLKLYDAGALFIGVIFLNGEPQGFRVALPSDLARRENIFAFLNRALVRAGFPASRDAGQDEISFWIMRDSYE